MGEAAADNASLKGSLGIGDIVVFSVLTAVGYIVGLYFSLSRTRRQAAACDRGAPSAVLEAFLGGRTLPAAALAVSVFASVATAVGVVSFVGHYYAYGFHLDWALAGIPLAAVVVSLIFVPLLYDLRVASVFQYLRMRFNNPVGITACVVYFLLSQSVGAVGIFSSAIAVSTMFPVALVYSNTAIGLAGTIYTALGGLRGVVWADCAQAIVMLLAPIVIIAKVLYDANFVTPPLRPMSDSNVTDFAFRLTFDVTNDENFWSGMAGALTFGFVRTGFDQMVVQRLMAARTMGQAKAIALAGPIFVLVFFILEECAGACIIYWFRDCDPVLRGSIKSYDQIVPYYMMKNLADVPLLRGLFLAGLVGASTSTVSSIVNSHAAIFYIDVVTPYAKISEQKAIFVMRLLAFASGTVMTLGAIAVPYLGTAARLFMSFYCSVGGPFTGLFLLAISSPWVNAKGAGSATLLVCVFLLWHAVGRSLSDVPQPPCLPKSLDRCPLQSNSTDLDGHPGTAAVTEDVASSNVFPLYLLSFYWISFIGAVLTVFLGTALSLLTGGHKNVRRHLRLTSPVFLRFWRKLRCLSQRVTASAGDRGATSAVLEAFLGGRTLPAAALAVSVLASAANAMIVVSFVGHYYAYGFHINWALTGIPLAAALLSYAFVPLLYNLRVASVFQYLRMRFDNTVGVTACVVYFLLSQSVGATGIFSAAIAVSTMFPVPLVYSNIGIGVAGTIYTALGGLRGVVWADCVQGVTMVLSPIVIITKVLYDSNSATPPLRSMSDINITDFAFRTTFDITNDENPWSGLAGALPFGLVRTGFDQMVVQRFMAARTLRQAKIVAFAGPFFVLVHSVLGSCCGVFIIYWFRDCDPVLRGTIKSYDQIVPHYMMKNLADVPMLRGLFLAGLVGASTSTVSSIVNSHAAIFYIDVITPYIRISEKKAVMVMRLLAFASGTVMTLFAVAVPYLGSTARLFMSFYCSVAGPFAGLFLLAMTSPWVNAKGIGSSTLLVCALLLWHAVGRSISNIPPPPLLPKSLDRCPLMQNTSIWTKDAPAHVHMQGGASSNVFPLYLVSFFWISFIGALLTMFLGTAVSLLTGGSKTVRKNVRLTSPQFLNLWRRFPHLRPVLEIRGVGINNGDFTLWATQQNANDELHFGSELDPIYEGGKHRGTHADEL